MKFRKKAVVIEAVQYTGNNLQYIIKELGMPEKDYGWKNFELYIHTLEGDHKASVGDWIIKGIKGEFYPVKPDIFEMTYEPVEE